MCVLLLLHRVLDDYPVLVAANRDEHYDRPGLPPEWVSGPGDRPFLAPKDPRAGGTWIGAAPHGFFVAITNRKKPDATPPADRSRGLLVRDALAAGTLDAALVLLVRELRQRHYDPCNLLLADGERAAVLHFDGQGEVACEELPAGPHLLINDHDVNPETVGDLVATLSEIRGHEAMFDDLQRLVQDHELRLPGPQSICKHGEIGGTTSSSLILLHRDDVTKHEFRYADGPPCRTPFVTHSLVAPTPEEGSR